MPVHQKQIQSNTHGAYYQDKKLIYRLRKTLNKSSWFLLVQVVLMIHRTFVPENFRSQERKFHRQNFHPQELLSHGTFIPRNFHPLILIIIKPLRLRTEPIQFLLHYWPSRSSKVDDFNLIWKGKIWLVFGLKKYTFFLPLFIQP